jgi:hypothetical protein
MHRLVAVLQTADAKAAEWFSSAPRRGIAGPLFWAQQHRSADGVGLTSSFVSISVFIWFAP